MYHAPKTKELQLKDKEGTVKTIVKHYKGKDTSANLPYRVEFMLELEGGKQQKWFAHLVSLYTPPPPLFIDVGDTINALECFPTAAGGGVPGESAGMYWNRPACLEGVCPTSAC